MKPVREGERRSRRMLGLAPEFKAEDLPFRTRRPKFLAQACGRSTPYLYQWRLRPLELPRDL